MLTHAILPICTPQPVLLSAHCHRLMRWRLITALSVVTYNTTYSLTAEH